MGSCHWQLSISFSGRINKLHTQDSSWPSRARETIQDGRAEGCQHLYVGIVAADTWLFFCWWMVAVNPGTKWPHTNASTNLNFVVKFEDFQCPAFEKGPTRSEPVGQEILKHPSCPNKMSLHTTDMFTFLCVIDLHSMLTFLHNVWYEVHITCLWSDCSIGKSRGWWQGYKPLTVRKTLELLDILDKGRRYFNICRRHTAGYL